MDFRAVDFFNFTLRLRLSRSVENLLLTSSLALLDSTLPKIRQNDGKGVRHTERSEVSLFFNFFCLVKTQPTISKMLVENEITDPAST